MLRGVMEQCETTKDLKLRFTDHLECSGKKVISVYLKNNNDPNHLLFYQTSSTSRIFIGRPLGFLLDLQWRYFSAIRRPVAHYILDVKQRQFFCCWTSNSGKNQVNRVAQRRVHQCVTFLAKKVNKIYKGVVATNQAHEDLNVLLLLLGR